MQEISYTKKYYEIYKRLSHVQCGGSYYTNGEKGILDFLTIVETKEVAEDFCKRHENCIYKEYSVQVSAVSCTSGSCVLD